MHGQLWLTLLRTSRPGPGDRPAGVYGVALVDYQQGSPLTYGELLVARPVTVPTGANAGTHVTVTGAGRTDSGVHALGQVISFTLASPIDARDLGRALNATLSEDVRVLSAAEAPADFNARFSARSRTYHYLLYNNAVRAPLPDHFLCHFDDGLEDARDRAIHRFVQVRIGKDDIGRFSAKLHRKALQCIKSRPVAQSRG